MHQSIRWLAIGALCVGGVVAVGCASEPKDGTGAGGAGTTSGNTSSSTMSNATSSNASTSTGGIGPCVLDSSNYDECTLQ